MPNKLLCRNCLYFKYILFHTKQDTCIGDCKIKPKKNKPKKK